MIYIQFKYKLIRQVIKRFETSEYDTKKFKFTEVLHLLGNHGSGEPAGVPGGMMMSESRNSLSISPQTQRRHVPLAVCVYEASWDFICHSNLI